jgi:hypothetical protein
LQPYSAPGRGKRNHDVAETHLDEDVLTGSEMTAAAEGRPSRRGSAVAAFLGWPRPSWRDTRVDFDLLFICLNATALLAWHCSGGVVTPELATAVLVVCDAWFAVSLEFGTSAASTVLGEAPLADLIFTKSI